MPEFRYTIEQFESLGRLGNDEVLYHLMQANGPLTMQDAMKTLRATDPVVRMVLNSINTKLRPLGYEVYSVLETGYILHDASTTQKMVQA